MAPVCGWFCRIVGWMIVDGVSLVDATLMQLKFDDWDIECV